MKLLGRNYRITDFQAALGISQLKKLDEFIRRKNEIVSMYNEAFDAMSEINNNPNDFPVTEEVFSRIVTFPLFPKMTEDEVLNVIDIVKEFGTASDTNYLYGLAKLIDKGAKV